MGDSKIYDNNGQYRGTGIPRYERIFGKGFISTGGMDTTVEVVQRMVDLGLKAGSLVLDVGCGIGGSAFYMHDKFGADVTGVDLAQDMYAEAVRNIGDRKGVRFLLGDAAVLDLGVAKYDFVYSRDCLLHIDDKAAFFRRFNELLKPGGHVVMTDYAFRNDEANLGAEFVDYYKKTGYYLCSLDNYKVAAEKGPFQVQVVDYTDRFLQSLKDEMGRMHTHRAEFVKDLPESDWEYLMERWTKKVRMVGAGDMKWALVIAHKQ